MPSEGFNLKFDVREPALPSARTPSVEYMSASYLFALGLVLVDDSPKEFLRDVPIIPPDEVCGLPSTTIYSKPSDKAYPSDVADCAPHPFAENMACPLVLGYTLSNTYLSKNVDSLSNCSCSSLDPSYGNC